MKDSLSRKIFNVVNITIMILMMITILLPYVNVLAKALNDGNDTAMGGILIGPLYGVYTMLGAGIGRKCFASAVVGGYGNMYGAIVGGLIIGVAETMIAGYVSSMYKDMFTYLILLIFLFVKPTGIFNEKTIQE